MNLPQAVTSQPEGEQHQGIANPRTSVSGRSGLDPDGVNRSTIDALSHNLDRLIRSSRVEIAVTALVLGLLLASLLGEKSSVVAFVLVAALCTLTLVEHPVMLIIATVALAANVSVLPAVLARPRPHQSRGSGYRCGVWRGFWSTGFWSYSSA